MEYRGLVLDPFQEAAITHLREGRSVLVSAPTGTGKTIIADYLVESALAEGRQVIYTAPVKALSNQKFRDWCRLHGEQNVGLVTGDLVIRRDAPCRVMTTEILRNMLLGGEPLEDLAAVVLDEIHYLGDAERGTAWEEVLIYLSPDVRVLGLSATLSNLKQFARWLTDVRGTRVEVITETERAVPLEISLYNKDVGLKSFKGFEDAWKRQGGDRSGGRGGRRGRGRGRGRDPGRGQESSTTSHARVIKDLSPGYLPILYFVFSRRNAEAFARTLGRRNQRGFLSGERLQRMRERLRQAREEIGDQVLSRELYELYERGIGFHHAGLHVQLKALVEGLYEDKLIAVLYTTSTFALGLNMPARTVVLDGLHKFNGQEVLPLTVQQFMQKAGRAGRRGMDERGQVVIRMDFEDYAEAREHLPRYLAGTPEEVRSAFNLSFNSVINLLERHPIERIRQIVGRSFLSFSLAENKEQVEDRIEVLERELEAAGWGAPGYDPKMSDPPKVIRQKAKELRRLSRRLERGRDRVWADFVLRQRFLTDIGYLAEDGGFNAGARVLRSIQIEELFTTELVLSGVLLALSPGLTFGLFTAMTGNLPRAARSWQKLNKAERALVGEVNRLRYAHEVVGAEEITGQETTWDPDLIPLGRGWAEGVSLDELINGIQSNTDLSGQLVSNFRRAKDLASQVRQACAEDEILYERLGALIKATSRDEVQVVD